VFITPSSCRAIIEVKTSITPRQLREAAEKLARNAELIRRASVMPLFVGLFSYELGRPNDGLLPALKEVANGDASRVVDHAALGPSQFVKYWTNPPEGGIRRYDRWHLYRLRHMAPGYFVHNVLAEACRGQTARRENAWWPQESKEVRLEQQLALRGA
jgi:hypothetical protein